MRPQVVCESKGGNERGPCSSVGDRSSAIRDDEATFAAELPLTNIYTTRQGC